MPRPRLPAIPALRLGAAVVALATPTLAAAHSFGRMYNLPVPFWMYIYGATAALLLSFLIAGWFMTVPVATAATAPPSAAAWRLLPRLLQGLQWFSVALLLLTLLSGLLGNRDPYRNFSMTFFWVVFVLGYAYLTALLGDTYALLNPWRAIAGVIERLRAGYTRGRFAYPARLGHWPALLLYMAFIWIELFGRTRPYSLALLLLAYGAITLAGIGLFGLAPWLRHGEFFGVFLRLMGRMAPLAWDEDGRLRLRAPFAGLLEERAESLSLLLFILFMLSSTAYDGLHATLPWVRLFWADPLGLLTSWLGRTPLYAYAQLRPWYLVWESAWLLLSPFIYLAIYLLFIALARRAAGSRLPLQELALRFAHSLLPIALVYNITHYYTLLLTQGVRIVSLFSDPFGRGWNLFGTAGWWRAPILPDMGWVWHSQVALILFGHVVSVVIAHHEALRCFPSRRRALLSQLPMLLLMMLFTGFGLWILAQPIQSGG